MEGSLLRLVDGIYVRHRKSVCVRVRLSISEMAMHVTSREKNVLDLIVRGLSDREIAQSLALSPYTARKHRQNLLQKFQVTKSTHLVMRYLAEFGDSMKNLANTQADFHLSSRELDVVRLLAEGLSDKQVARRLGISDQTARKHRANLLHKIGAVNVCSLLVAVTNAGWLAAADDLLPIGESA